MLKFLQKLLLFTCFSILGLGLWTYNSESASKRIRFLLSGKADTEVRKDSLQISALPILVKPVPRPKKNKSTKKKTSFKQIDSYARNTPDSISSSLPKLATYLAQGAKSDLEKVRAVYVWICENIRYDDKSFNAQDYPLYTVNYVLQYKEAVCEGFSVLFKALTAEMGLESKKVVGYAKGYGYNVGDAFTDNTHAWNVVKIEGEWKIFDATWGQGFGKTVNGKLKTTKKFDDYWFDVNPYEAIFTHLPENTEVTYTTPTITLQEYEQLPYIRKTYFQLGFSGKETLDLALRKPDLKTPEFFSYNTHIKIKKAPREKTLSLGKVYNFSLYIPQGLEVAMIDDKGGWTYFKGKKNTFSHNFVPTTPGPIKLSVKHKKSKERFETILIYEVEAPINL